MLLYHGTNEISAKSIYYDGIDFAKSKNYLDFGKGFYMTNDMSAAEKRAQQKTIEYNSRHNCCDLPAIVSLEYNETPGLNIRTFSRFIKDVEWAKFVVANRLPNKVIRTLNIQDHNKDCRYDIVIGGIADNEITVLKDLIIDGDLLFDNIQLDYVLKDNGQDLGHQLSIHTKEGLACLSHIKYDIINPV